jgi:hypothetical protein
MDVTELIAAIVAIAKDPEAWEKRLANVKEAGSKLAEARMAEKQANDKAKAAAADLETARYERGQSERATRDAAAQANANAVQARDQQNERVMLRRERDVFEQEARNWKANYEQREAELATREREVAKKLNDAQKLMAAYDEAKHKAALKLAS